MKKKIFMLMLVGIMSMGIMPNYIQANDSNNNTITKVQPKYYYASEDVSNTSRKRFKYNIDNAFDISKVFYSNNASNDAYISVYLNNTLIDNAVVSPYSSYSKNFGVKYKDNIEVEIYSVKGQLNGYFSARAD